MPAGVGRHSPGCSQKPNNAAPVRFGLLPGGQQVCPGKPQGSQMFRLLQNNP
jgi:hypothetical protein